MSYKFLFFGKLNKNFPLKKLKLDFFQKGLPWLNKNSNNCHNSTFIVKQSSQVEQGNERIYGCLKILNTSR